MPQPLNSSRDVSRATVAAGLGRQDAAPEQMADVRTQRVDLLLLAVERQRIVAALAVPERLVERVAQRSARRSSRSANAGSCQRSRASLAVRRSAS
jgi:hypothetical protein